MDLAVRAYIKGDTHEGSEKQQKNVYKKIKFTYAIPCNDIIACFLFFVGWLVWNSLV